MAAWRHWRYWDTRAYNEYRAYVTEWGPRYKGRREDCADITLTLLVEFAARAGLPVTFQDNDKVRYPSKGSHQSPRAVLSWSWNTVEEYLNAVKRRISSKALLNENTEVNRGGPEPGDLMVKHDHTALVFAIYRAGQAHPRGQDRSIPVFPGPEQARLQLSQTEYFRQAMPAPSDKRPNEIDHETHFDYLNHRGEGKQAAELILYARVSEMRQQGFEFRKYKANVLDNWPDWNGMGDPPR